MIPALKETPVPQVILVRRATSVLRVQRVRRETKATKARPVQPVLRGRRVLKAFKVCRVLPVPLALKEFRA